MKIFLWKNHLNRNFLELFGDQLLFVSVILESGVNKAVFLKALCKNDSSDTGVTNLEQKVRKAHGLPEEKGVILSNFLGNTW